MTGFWMRTPGGVIAHVTGDRNMSEQSAAALAEVIEAAHARMLADGKPGKDGNDEDHEPDEPDPNGV